MQRYTYSKRCIFPILLLHCDFHLLIAKCVKKYILIYAQFARNHKATTLVQAIKPGKVEKQMQRPRKACKVVAL